MVDKLEKPMVIINTEERLTIILNDKVMQWEWKPADLSRRKDGKYTNES